MSKMKEILINRPIDAIPLLRGYASKRQEHFGILCLDSGHRVLRKKVLFVGGDSKCQIWERVIYWEACKANFAGVILFHNHPTGNCLASVPDRDLTKKLAEGFNTLGIELLDHIIIGKPWGTETSYFSFLEHDLHDLLRHDKDGAFLTVAN